MRYNIFGLQRRLELMKGERVSLAQIAGKAGVHVNTLYRLSSASHKTVNLDTLAALLQYFRNEGMDITIGDLFEELPANGNGEPT